jgi:hypothetical protein
MSWNKSRLYGEQNICPRNKLWLEKMEQKYRIRRTNHVYGGNKSLDHKTNQDYTRNKNLVRVARKDGTKI